MQKSHCARLGLCSIIAGLNLHQGRWRGWPDRTCTNPIWIKLLSVRIWSFFNGKQNYLPILITKYVLGWPELTYFQNIYLFRLYQILIKLNISKKPLVINLNHFPKDSVSIISVCLFTKHFNFFWDFHFVQEMFLF